MNLTELFLARLQYNPAPLMQTRYDKNGGANIVYVGYAPAGKATSEASWFIIKYTYDGDNEPELRQVSSQASIWDNRATSVTYS